MLFANKSVNKQIKEINIFLDFLRYARAYVRIWSLRPWVCINVIMHRLFGGYTKARRAVIDIKYFQRGGYQEIMRKELILRFINKVNIFCVVKTFSPKQFYDIVLFISHKVNN